MTDAVVLSEIGQRLERLRLERNITQAELARQAGISRRTLVRLEQGEELVGAAALLRVLRALGLLGQVEQLVPEALPSPIEQLRLQGRRRQRASGSKRDDVAAPWTWGADG
jgi:putative transcriptional regulator